MIIWITVLCPWLCLVILFIWYCLSTSDSLAEHYYPGPVQTGLKQNVIAATSWQQQQQQQLCYNYSVHGDDDTRNIKGINEILLLWKVLSENVKVKRNYDLLDRLNARRTDPLIYFLDEESSEFKEVRNFFEKTNKKCFVVTDIVKINNPILKMQYLLKKQQIKERNGFVLEQHLFHGTRRRNLEHICKHNFNWRLYRRHEVGRGVYFCNDAYYATYYGDTAGYKKTMILSKVIVHNTCRGYEWMALPPPTFDSTTNHDDKVVVKYCDDEFLPLNIIFYEGFDRE